MTTNTDRPWVVDASVALKWYLLDEDFIEEAAVFRDGYVNERLELIAPDYIRYEILNALEVARIQRRITSLEANEGFGHFLGLGFHLPHDDDLLLLNAAGVSRRFVVAPYDALYVALAETTGSLFVTADERLYRRIEGEAHYARWLGDIQLPS